MSRISDLLLRFMFWSVCVLQVFLIVCLVLWPTEALPAQARVTYKGTVTKVLDGDSIFVNIEGFPVPFNPIEVRMYGIDTPETRKQDAKCVKERRLGTIAKFWMIRKLPVGTVVTVEWVGKREKFGRLLADVYLGTENLSKTMVDSGMAAVYYGAKKPNWCN